MPSEREHGVREIWGPLHEKYQHSNGRRGCAGGVTCLAVDLQQRDRPAFVALIRARVEIVRNVNQAFGREEPTLGRCEGAVVPLDQAVRMTTEDGLFSPGVVIEPHGDHEAAVSVRQAVPPVPSVAHHLATFAVRAEARR